MIIICQMCNKEFEWEPVYGSSQRCKPTICGKRIAGKWVLDEKCKELRQQAYNEKHKQHTPKRPRKKKQPKYESKNMPKPAKKHICQRCKKKTSNRINCPTCRKALSKQIAGDEYIFVDGGEDLVDRFDEAVR